MKSTLAALLALPLLLTGCGDEPGPGSGPQARPVSGPQAFPTGDPDQLALAITTVSAWPNVVVPRAPTPPEIRIAGDGSFRATVYDADTESWELLTGRLDRPTLVSLVADATALPEGWEAYGEPGLDGSSTNIHLGEGSGLASPRDADVWVPEADGYTGSAREHREQVLDLLDDLDTAVRSAGDTWQPETYLMISSEITASTVQPDDDPRPVWPLPDVDPRGTVRDRIGCQPVGTDVDRRLQPLLDDPLSGAAGWTHAGTAYGVLLLPVLADETCADLEPYRWPLDG